MRLFLIFSFYLLSITCSKLRANDIQFSTLTKEGILDRQSILCITQDNQGRIIFGGQSELFYFDSYHIEKLNLGDYVDKSGFYIEHIAVTNDNILIIASKNKLLFYDLFRKKLLLTDDANWNNNLSILKLERINDQIFLLCKNGLYILEGNPKNYRFTRKVKVANPRNITFLSDDKYILSCNSGLYEISINGNTIRYTKNLNMPVAMEPVCTLYENGRLWIGTSDHGIFKLNYTNGSWENINQINSNLLSNNVRKIRNDKNGSIYIGTLRGISILHPDSQEFKNYRHESGKRHSLSQNSVYDIFIDNQENIWIGTYFGGLNYIHKNPYNITTYNSSDVYSSHLNSEVISSVSESKDYVWIATEEEGLAKLNKKTKQITNLSSLTNSNLIKDIFIKDDFLYIAQIGAGYSIYNIENNTIQHINIRNTKKNFLNDVNRIFVDKKGNIYLSTISGLLISHLSNPTNFKKLNTTQYSTFKDIAEDSNNNVYILIGGALYVKSQNKSDLEVFQPTKGLDIKSFYIKDDTFWLVTNNEILKMIKNQPISSVHKFKNNSNAKIIAHNSKLWIARNEGLFCYDLISKTENIITQPDGLLVKNLANSRLFLSSDNQLYITSLNGLMSLYPDKVIFNTRIPSTILQDISGTDDQPISFDRLIKIDSNQYELSLNYFENNFTVNFASNNLSKPLKNKFRYKLQDFETQWNETNIPVAKYSKISPGKYTLEILSSNNDNIWATEMLSLRIIIKPPFWKTWWAYFFYGIATLVLLHYLIKFIVEREILINSEKEYQKKINFFTQISHEIRTPLTLIAAPIDDILEATKHDHETSNKLFRLKKNANKLLSIVNELLDFKKIDAGKEIYNPNPIDAKHYLENHFYLFSDLAITKQLNFHTKNIESDIILNLDTKQFDKVIHNLLSNAIKYTPNNGIVFLDTKVENNNFLIEVWDNGIGLEKDNEFKIFEEYYRDANTQDNIGTGIGLALTKKIVEQHQGKIVGFTTYLDAERFTCFRVELPFIRKQSTISEESIFVDSSLEIIDPSNKELLLIVEDNIELHEVIESIFKEKFTILKAYDGAQGLKLAKEFLPTLIISDVMMPVMDGLQMCEKIKTDEKTAHIPIIMLTANTTEETQLKSLKYGSNIYLYKPFNPNILSLTVSNLVNLTNAKRQQFSIDKKELTVSEIDLNFLNKLEKIIDNNLLNEQFGVEFISKDLGMSTPILYKKVKAITNLSVNNFVKAYRFKKAITLMKDNHNISEAAYAVGFSDRKYFSKEFKKIYGVSPSTYLNIDETDL